MKRRAREENITPDSEAAEFAENTAVRGFKKRDLLVPAVIAAAILVIWFCFQTREDAVGGQAVVTIDGEEYGSYPLDTDQEIPIYIDGVQTNILIISDGAADMTEADCPDQICVNHASISKEHETIVCLPNKVVVEIESAEDSGLDATAN